MNKRFVLGTFAVSVFVLVVGLLIILRAEEPAQTLPMPVKEAPPSSGETNPPADSPPQPDAPVVPTPALAPSPPLPSPSPAPSSITTRDHRGEPPLPPEERLSIITSETAANIRKQVQPAIKACAAPLSSRDKGRIQISFTAVITGGNLTARDIVVRHEHLKNEVLHDCVRGAYRSLSMPVPPGQVDGEQALVTTFTLP